MTISDGLFDVVVVGAGFGGLHMIHSLREHGFSVQCFEAASDVGGAWYWNRYPGARCDVESLVYSYSFSKELDEEWRWSERYSAQPEIQAYLRFASERLDLRQHIRFNTFVKSADFENSSDTWLITCDNGITVRSRFCVMATGPISVPILPDIEGIKDFEGRLIHTARWPQNEVVDFRGKKVGVIGTGSSGTQLIPKVAREAELLTVFLRTPNFVVQARNAPLDEQTMKLWKEKRTDIRNAMRRGEIGGAGDIFMPEDLKSSRMRPAEEFTPSERQTIMQRRWDGGGAAIQSSFSDVMRDEMANAEVAEFVRGKITDVVKDPETVKKLTPRGYALGTKRICVGTDYYETFNRENVEVIDVKETPISKVTPQGIQVGDQEIKLDMLLLATGFDALTGALGDIEITGDGGTRLADAWSDGPHTYLGLSVANFPNLFLIGGPGSPSVLTNVVMTNEFQVDFITDLLIDMRKRGNTRVTASQAEQDAWTEQVNAIAQTTLLAKADSWYVGANVPGKPRVILAYTGGIAAYRSVCSDVLENEFKGFIQSSRRDSDKDRIDTATVTE